MNFEGEKEVHAEDGLEESIPTSYCGTDFSLSGMGRPYYCMRDD